ncbi:MAG: hypothetical protein QOE39_935, partial [Bradyrhizobium sp.]|nr:hypothetical protein [Bradyrhizobium sp.]
IFPVVVMDSGLARKDSRPGMTAYKLHLHHFIMKQRYPAKPVPP